MEGSAPGRACPLSYGYRARDLAAGSVLEAAAVYVVGGLYGNRFALEEILRLGDAEQDEAVLVFNGDFHWFDADPDTFDAVNREVLRHHALRGNVETEIAGEDQGAGCGCGYPDWVGDAEVERSNRILARLRETARAFPGARRALGRLPMHLAARVGPLRIGIVHGDGESLAGWGLSQERLPENRETIARWLAEAGVDGFASSHTCLPVAAAVGDGILINNGAAGMPNFSGTRFGVITRVGLGPSPVPALYAARHRGVYVEALPVHYDHEAWVRQFLQFWPEGSDAHASYMKRILHGPGFSLAHAVGEGFSVGIGGENAAAGEIRAA